MIDWKYAVWRSAGAAAAIGLAACGGEGGGEAGETANVGEAGLSGEAGEVAPAAAAAGGEGGEQGEAGVTSAFAGVSGDQRIGLRLQHLRGFVLAARAAADAGRIEEAAILVQQGLLEAHDPFADEFGSLALAPVQAAGEASGLDRAAYGERLRAAEQALDAAGQGLDIDHAALAARMADIATGLYQHVLQQDFVDPIEYQHSHGAALAARQALTAGAVELRRRDARAYDAALREVERFVALWPSVDPPAQPASYRDVLAQSSRVRLALSPYL